MSEFINMNGFTKLLAEKPKIVEAMLVDEDRYQIARAIIAERIKRGWSQGTLARKARLTQAQISRLERARLGNFETILKTLDALDLKLEVSPKHQ